MKSFLIASAKATLGFLVISWITAKIFPQLIPSILSGATPNIARD